MGNAFFPINAHHNVMSWTWRPLTILAGLGAGVVGVVATVHALKRWRSYYFGSVRSANIRGKPSSSQRKLKLYHTVEGRALPNTPYEHVFPFRSSRCVWLVSELGIHDSVEIERIDLQGQDVIQYREVHPHATLPALKLEDGSVLLESSAICLYLSESFLDPENHSLLPDEKHVAQYYK